MIFESFIFQVDLCVLYYPLSMDSLAKSLMADTATKTTISKKRKRVQKVCLTYFKVVVPNVCAEKFILKFVLNSTKVGRDDCGVSKVKL